MTSAAATLSRLAGEDRPGAVARRRRGLARAVGPRAARRARLHLRGRLGEGPARQGRRRADAGAPPRRGRRRLLLGRLPGAPRGARDRAQLQRRSRRRRRLAQDARQARRRGLRALAPRLGLAALRRGRDRARARPDHRRAALPAERSRRHGLAPLLRRGVSGPPLRPSDERHDRERRRDHPAGHPRPARAG